MKNIKHTIKNYYLRITRGIGCCDVHDFDYFLADTIARGMKYFAERTYSYPGFIATSEEWRDICNEMAEGFALYRDERSGLNEEMTKQQIAKYNKAKKLFIKHFESFWI